MASYHRNRGIKYARQARERLGIPLDEPVPDVLEAAEAAGLPIAVAELGDSYAGVYLRRDDGVLAIVTTTDAPQRQRFTAAHELGHHELGHLRSLDTAEAFSSHDPLEVEANAFAAEFLVPRRAAERWAAEHLPARVTLEHVVRFGLAFGVSAKAACIRLQTARIVRDDGLCARLHEEIDAGEHHALGQGLEDLAPDDTLARLRGAPWIPPSLRRGALGRFAHGDGSLDDVALATGRPLEDIRDSIAPLGLLRAAG